MICIFIMSANAFMHKTSLITLLILTILYKNVPQFSAEELRLLNGPWKSLFRLVYTFTEDLATLSIFIENRKLGKIVDFSEQRSQLKSISGKNEKDLKEVYIVDDLQLYENQAYNPRLYYILKGELNQFNVENLLLQNLLQNELLNRLEAIYYNNDARIENTNTQNVYAAVSSVVKSSGSDYYYRYSCGSCCGCCSCCC